MFSNKRDRSTRKNWGWLVFLSFMLLQADYILAKSIGSTSEGNLKSIQQLAKATVGRIVSDKVPQVIANRISAGSVEEFIVLFDTQDVKLQVSEMRLSKALLFDDQNIINFKAAQFAAIKQKVMATFAISDIEMIEDYSQLPMAFIRCKSVTGLKQLINNPLVKSIYENKRNQMFLSESLPLINQPQAAINGFTGAGTTVAVLDTGLDYTRPAFGTCSAPGIPANCRVIHAQDFAIDDGVLDGPSEHGSNVAGIVLGVAPNTQIAALDVFNGSTASYSDIISAINWVIANKTQHNIVAMNLSLGFGQAMQECPADGLSQPFLQARAAGVLPVVATGNEGFKDSIAHPACAPGAVRVGAVYDSNVGGPWTWGGGTCTDNQTSADLVTCFSNSAPFMTLLAPGAFINAAGLQTGGTSQATPHVAGAIAVIRAANAFPTESLGQTVTRLITSGLPVTDPQNSLVKPRLDLLAAVEAVILPTFPEVGTPLVFQQLNIANGVTTDGSGNIYVHYDNGLNVVSKFTPDGVLQWSTTIGGPLDIGRTGRLTILPSTGEILDLLGTGELVTFNPITGAGNLAFDFRQITIDTSNVYEAASGSVMNMSAQILQPNIVYGDVSILQLDNQFDIFAAGLSTNSAVPFVIRFRFINLILTEAKVLVASILQTGNQNGGTVAPRGVAVNNQGTVLTSLPVLPCQTCTVGVDVGITFDANFEPATDLAPVIILDKLDLHSLGMGTDSMGNFYLATGATGTSFCGASGSGALVVVSESMDNVGCGEIGAILSGSNDVVLNPTEDTAYMSLSSSLTFNGVLEFPITHPPVIIDNDGDGIADDLDNCTFAANADQLDTDNDGIGDVCQCGDVNRDGFITNTDAVLIQRHLLSLPPGIDQAFCDVNGDGQCTNTDAVIIKRKLLGLPPGISQACTAASAPI